MRIFACGYDLFDLFAVLIDGRAAVCRSCKLRAVGIVPLSVSLSCDGHRCAVSILPRGNASDKSKIEIVVLDVKAVLLSHIRKHDVDIVNKIRGVLILADEHLQNIADGVDKPCVRLKRRKQSGQRHSLAQLIE